MSEIRQVICQSEPLHIVDIQAIHVNANAYPEIEANTWNVVKLRVKGRKEPNVINRRI